MYRHPAPAELAYQALGGSSIGSPASIAQGNRLDTFVVGADHALYHKTLTPAGWQPARGLENLGGYVLGRPAAIATEGGRIDIFVVGADHAPYHKYTSNGGSTGGLAWLPSQGGYENLGGIIVGQPVVNSRFAGRLDVFIVGTDQALYHKWWDSKYEGSGWIFDPKVWNPGAWLQSLHGFESLGGHLIGTPQVTSGAYDPYNNNIHLNMVAEGTDHAVYDKYWDGNPAPAATSTSAGTWSAR